MPTKIRLQRKGKKGVPFYHVVIADGRAPRDGKFIERIGIYNPVSTPAEIDINFERALYWLQAGAEPTDTVNALLSFKGILYKHHLLKGVKKGAMTEEIAEAKFQAWLQEKKEKFVAKIKEVELSSKDGRKKRIEAEMKVNEARAKELQAKRAKELKAKLAEEDAAVEAEDEEKAITADEAAAEVKPAAEEPAAEVKRAAEELAAEVKPAAEEPADEVKPAAEEPAEVKAKAATETEPEAEEPGGEEPPEEAPPSEEETETKA
jgi:small subunit ribosomal protein S16